MKFLVLICFYLSFLPVSAQQFSLDVYIDTALNSNLSIQQKEASYEKSILALKEARGLFFPSVDINARYTVARGGRMIDFPVGDLLNPVYNTLNALTQSQIFPQIENESFSFYREQEHETKFRLTQPIINSEIYYNERIKKDLVKVEEASLDVFRRDLVSEVKSAYFMYWQSLELLKIMTQTEELLLENIRINERLFENDMVTEDNIFKSKAELSKFEQERSDAIKNHNMARAYFNFLLNRDLDNIIQPDSSILNFTEGIYVLDELVIKSTEEREEIKQLEYYQSVNHNITKLNKSAALPNVTGVVDYGFQGEEYSFTTDDDYMLASIVLQWNLFNGLQKRRKTEQAKIDEMIIRDKLKETKQQINLQVVNSYYGLDAAYKKIEAAQNELNASAKSFEIVRKKYNQGIIPLIEFINARNEYTGARRNLIISKYDYLIKHTEFERISCLYDLNSEDDKTY